MYRVNQKNVGLSLSVFGLIACFCFALVFADDPVPPAPAPNPVVEQPTISIPKELQADVGAFVEVAATTNGSQVKWIVLNQQGLNLFPMDLLKDSKTAVAVAAKDGVYYLHAWTALNNIPSDLVTCKITIGNPQPIPPAPQPIPPQPIPPQPVPVPTPTKLSVLFLEESMDLGTANYKPYLEALNSGKVRAYLNSHTAMENIGTVTLPSWRRWDKDTDVSHESAKWQSLIKVHYDSLPWLVIANEDGSKILSSSPIPGNESSTLDLLKKYGG